MNYKNLFYAAVLCTTGVLSSCDTVDEADRFIYVKPDAVGRNVLIEDFTGQRCVNCPNATLEIAKLHELYGDTVIGVGIHSGPFAKTTRGKPYSLYTETGDEYFNYWKVESQPKGVIDRTGTSDYTSWTTIVRDELSKTAPVSLWLYSEYNKATHKATFTVTATGIDGDSKGKLQLWLIEDGIVDFQYMPDGTTNREYVHNHVFRTAVNGTWGTDFTIKEGETRTEFFEYQLENEEWVPENLSLVAFVYNGNGVLQVSKCIFLSTIVD